MSYCRSAILSESSGGFKFLWTHNDRLGDDIFFIYNEAHRICVWIEKIRVEQCWGDGRNSSILSDSECSVRFSPMVAAVLFLSSNAATFMDVPWIAFLSPVPGSAEPSRSFS